MATPVTRAALVTRLLQRANTSGFVDPTVEAPQLIDTACAKMHNMLVGLYQDYFTKATTYTLVADQDTYALPADYLKARQVWFVSSTGRRFPLQRLELSDLIGMSGNGGDSLPVSGYATMANQLVLAPIPTSASSGSVLMWYIPEYAPDANDDTPLFPALAFGWDEWVVLDACIQVRAKSMMPAEDLMAERAALEQKIQHQAQNRDAGAAQRVRDTGWGGRLGGGRGRGQFSIT